MTFRIRKTLLAMGPVWGLLFVFVLFALLAPPEFTSFYNIKTMMTQSVIIGIAALGMTFVIISRGIDLSVGSQVALGTVVIAVFIGQDGSVSDVWGPLWAGMGGIAACGLIGLLGAFFITRFGVVPFIVTLGTMQVARGVAKWIGMEQTVPATDSWLNTLMLIDPEPSWLILAPGIWIALLLMVVSSIVLRRTVFGRYVFAIGSNEQTARLCGVNIHLHKIIIYTLCGIFTGIAAVMQFSSLTIGDPTSAIGLELDIIAAVVIGGGSLNGGEGSAVGAMIGALLMAVLRNGCNMIGVPTFVQEILIGAIIVGAVLVDQQRHRLKKVA